MVPSTDGVNQGTKPHLTPLFASRRVSVVQPRERRHKSAAVHKCFLLKNAEITVGFVLGDIKKTAEKKSECNTVGQGSTFVFFDVDGTVIDRDSFRLLVFFAARQGFLRALLIFFALPLALSCGAVCRDRSYAKSVLLWASTVGYSRKKAALFLYEFGFKRASRYWFHQVDEVLQQAAAQGVQVCFISASGQLWLRGLLKACVPLGVPYFVLGTRLGFWGGGVIMRSPNCYSHIKCQRIVARFGKAIFWKQGYSDHPADIPLLDACAERFVVSPRQVHVPLFEKQWKEKYSILNWKRE